MEIVYQGKGQYGEGHHKKRALARSAQGRKVQGCNKYQGGRVPGRKSTRGRVNRGKRNTK